MKYVRFVLGATICLFAIYGGYELYVQKFTPSDDPSDIVQELRDAGFDIGTDNVVNDLSTMMQSEIGTPKTSLGMEASTPPSTPGLPSNGRASNGLPSSLRSSANTAPATVVVPEHPLEFESVNPSLHAPETFQPVFEAPLYLNPGSATVPTPPPTFDPTGEATSTGRSLIETPPILELDLENTIQPPIHSPPVPSVQEQTSDQAPVQWSSAYTFGVAMSPTVQPAEQPPTYTSAQETAAYQSMITTPHPQVQPLPPIDNTPVNLQINPQVSIPRMQVTSLPPVEDEEVPTMETRWTMTPALPNPPPIALPDPPLFETPPAGQPPQYVQNDPGNAQSRVTIPTQISPSDQQFVRQDINPQMPSLPTAPTPATASPDVQQMVLPQNPGQMQQNAQVNNVTPLPQSPDSEIAPEVTVKVAKIGELLTQGQVNDAYDQLSRMYFYDEMTPEEQQYVAKHLDLLAGSVLFSRTRHILEPPYMVKEGDTIESIATQYKITPELLRKLNCISDDRSIVADMELKVLRGPLDARIYPDFHELVIMMRDKYACRFPISVGSSYAGQAGNFIVQEKALNRGYQLAPGMEVIPPGDPNNPLGSQWIELSKEQGTIGIHGTNRPEQIGTTRRSAGFFGLRDKDITEVFDMLTVGSNVTIVR